MKRLMIIMLTVLLVTAVFVSCKVEVSGPPEGTVTVRFRTEDTARSLNSARETLDTSKYYWYYTAAKTDDSPATGTKVEETLVGTNGKLTEAITDSFSLGKWNFVLKGYTTTGADKTLVYSGSVKEYELKDDTRTIDITVEPQKTPGKKGTLKVEEGIKFTANGRGYTATKVTVSGVDGGSDQTQPNAENGYYTYALDSGSYKVTVIYESGGVTYAVNTIYVNVWNSLTTIVGGTLDEITIKASFDAKENTSDGSVAQTAVLTDNTEATYSFVHSPANHEFPGPSSDLGTTVKGTFAKTEGATEARITVTTYDTVSAGKTGTFTVADGSATVAALEITLENASIKDNGVAVVTTYISKGLSSVKLYHSNNQMDATAKDNENEVTANGNWFYDSSSGKLVFATSSFSPFHVTTDMNVYDVANNTSYKLEKKGEDYKFYDAGGTEVTSVGGSLVLLDCSLSNAIPDKYASALWQVVHNRCSSSGEDCHEESALFSGGMGTKIEPYLIADKDQFQKITDMYDKYAYYKIADGYTETDLGNWTPVYLHGSFDGNSKAFTNVTSSIFMKVGYYDSSSGFKEENITLKNFSAEMKVETSGNGIVKIISNSGTTRFENITVTGSIFGQWHVASFYNYGTAQAGGGGASYRVDFVKCKSTATLISPVEGTGGFIGHGYEGSGNTLTLNFDEESVYEGTSYTPRGNGSAYIVMCSNYDNPKVKIGEQSYTTGWDGEWNKYKSEKNISIKKADPKAGTDGYTVDVEPNASKIVVYVNTQLSAYDSSGNKIPNLQGITLALERRELTDATSSTVLLKKVTSASIDNAAEAYGYTLSDAGAMTVKVPGNHNYQDGSVNLTVVQYGSDGTVLACGTLKVFTITK